MKVGDDVKVIPSHAIDEDGQKMKKPLKGIVRYIHPKGRFYLVEFAVGRTSFRECFAGDQL